MARSLVQLKHLQIYRSVSLEEVVSTQEYGEESTDNMFCKLEYLQLMDLPNLTRFCSGNYIEFPSLEKLELVNCTKLEAFVSDHVSTSISICREIEQRVSNEINHYVETGAQSFLFDEKVIYIYVSFSFMLLPCKYLSNICTWLKLERFLTSPAVR